MIRVFSQETKVIVDIDVARVASTWRSGKRGHERWTAWVGADVVTPPPEDDRVDWPNLEAAQAACDARLREEGVVVT